MRDVLLERNLISPADMALFKVTNSVDEAVAEILNFYRVYHSMRYVGTDLVLRLKKRLAEPLLTAIRGQFADIFRAGTIRGNDRLAGRDQRRPSARSAAAQVLFRPPEAGPLDCSWTGSIPRGVSRLRLSPSQPRLALRLYTNPKRTRGCPPSAKPQAASTRALAETAVTVHIGAVRAPRWAALLRGESVFIRAGRVSDDLERTIAYASGSDRNRIANSAASSIVRTVPSSCTSRTLSRMLLKCGPGFRPRRIRWSPVGQRFRIKLFGRPFPQQLFAVFHMRNVAFAGQGVGPVQGEQFVNAGMGEQPFDLAHAMVLTPQSTSRFSISQPVCKRSLLESRNLRQIASAVDAGT